jgi:uncharacterized protein with HEPN domain
MRVLQDRLLDIIEAIEKIEKVKQRGKAAFDEDPMIQVWMVHHLMIIGEAVRAIDPAVRQKHPEVPWRDIVGMRNVLVHDYFSINAKIVWETVSEKLDPFKAKIQEMLAAMESAGDEKQAT